MKKSLLLLSFLILLVFIFNGCISNESESSETLTKTTVETTTAPSTAEETQATTYYYDFDENIYYSTPEGVFMKPQSPTNADGERVIGNFDFDEVFDSKE